MRRVQLGGDGGKREPFVLSNDDYDAIERAGKVRLDAAARSLLQSACESFLNSLALAKGRPTEADVRSRLLKLEAGLKATSSALHDLAEANETSETASIWLQRHWLGDVQRDDFVVSVELALASVQKALRELGSITTGAAKGPEPNLHLSSFVSKLQRVYDEAGGTKTFQAFVDAVTSTFPGRGYLGHSPDKRAKKQQLMRAKRKPRPTR